MSSLVSRCGRAAGALVVLAAGFATAAAPAALAQQPDSGQVRLRTWRSMDPQEIFSIVATRRARLGVKVNLQARETDSIGASVEGVTPGSPAERAGIRSGDVITKLAGTTLVRSGGDNRAADGAGRSLPGLRLIELAAQLKPNDTVSVELRRGKGWKERKTVRVVTSAEPESFALRGGGPDRPFWFRMGPEALLREDGLAPLGALERGAPRMAFMFGGPLAALELAPLNPDLGQYFGTDDGVLVISAPKDSKLGLRGGDVVLAVDGRKPTSPSHLLRILRSYDSGERCKIEVLRNHKRETVTATLDTAGTPAAPGK